MDQVMYTAGIGLTHSSIGCLAVVCKAGVDSHIILLSCGPRDFHLCHPPLSGHGVVTGPGPSATREAKGRGCANTGRVHSGATGADCPSHYFERVTIIKACSVSPFLCCCS